MQIGKHKNGICAIVIAGFGIVSTGTFAGEGYGGPYGFGTTPTVEELAAVDTDAMGDGRGLPPGRGRYAEGKLIYEEKCASCHGDALQGVKEVSGPPLIGGRGTIGSEKSKPTIESFWPYAPTVFDYTKRAMPFNAPGSLSDDEIYAVVAFMLGEAKIVAKDQEMNAETLARVRMPNRDGFVSDPRPDVFNFD
jgi:cytochrome c5